jgi:ribose 5-phosphate isomerase B
MTDTEKSAYKLAIGSDHAGYLMKEKIKSHLFSLGYDVIDFGTDSEISTDYPEYAHRVSTAVESGKYLFGILLCGSGNGVSMTANKHSSIRAALCWIPELAKLSRVHNDANILTLPARFIDEDIAMEIVDTFLNNSFEGGRHCNRVNKIPLKPE